MLRPEEVACITTTSNMTTRQCNVLAPLCE
jgi:hypothetical protein